MRLRWKSRLFWKLLISYWLGMNLAMLGTIAYFDFMGITPPAPKPDIWAMGPLPLAPLLIGSLVIAFISLALAWSLSRPIWYLKWAFREVSAGKLNTRALPLMGRQRDEIADLASEFDGMVSQLQKLIESRTVLLHDISHELRSPLTRLQGVVSLMRQDATPSSGMQDRIERECQRLDALIEELLTLHRLESGAMVGARVELDLVEILHAIVDDADFEARGQGKSVTLSAPASFVTVVDGELIYRAHENVIRNAIKYSPAHTEVVVSVTLDEDQQRYVCEVSDRGPGVPNEMLDEIFEPFVRVQGAEPARGVGLGLAIAKRAMVSHGGAVHAVLREGGGLVVSLTLPLHPTL